MADEDIEAEARGILEDEEETAEEDVAAAVRGLATLAVDLIIAACSGQDCRAEG